ncbi:MAG: hypothetical protein K5850_06955 [Bacteroidales bacterium]|nr:hypothetical protein [Bacteroidales bacterium]
MGLFSRKKKVEEAVFTIPSMDEQKAMAKASVDAFLNQITSGWDLAEEGICEWGRFRIAGITNYCGFSDIGMIRGITYQDKNNGYDKKAVGILGVDEKGRKKHLGYIPKDRQNDYYELAGDASNLIFIGYIRKFITGDDYQGIQGIIRVYTGQAGSKLYDRMVEDTQLIMGVFKGYYEDQDLRNNPDELRWALEDNF